MLSLHNELASSRHHSAADSDDAVGQAEIMSNEHASNMLHHALEPRAATALCNANQPPIHRCTGHCSCPPAPVTDRPFYRYRAVKKPTAVRTRSDHPTFSTVTALHGGPQNTLSPISSMDPQTRQRPQRQPR